MVRGFLLQAPLLPDFLKSGARPCSRVEGRPPAHRLLAAHPTGLLRRISAHGQRKREPSAQHQAQAQREASHGTSSSAEKCPPQSYPSPGSSEVFANSRCSSGAISLFSSAARSLRV